ncbi:MAG TPA: carbohydrate binding domain-containing protein, partial [Candidatus Methanoperedens sp.]|nr:carbohydrate binding domain-containing protein [Candidatus Methanoperedens sp.]
MVSIIIIIKSITKNFLSVLSTKNFRDLFLISFLLLFTFPILASCALAYTDLLLNPGFESGTTTPLNWTLVNQGGNTPIWDSVSHSGSRSIKISIPGTTNIISGYPQSDLIIAQPLAIYAVSMWGKTQNAGGTNTPAARVVELDANKNWIRQTNLPVFSRGTNDWTQKTVEFQIGSNTKYLYVYANIWKGYGNFWIDDVELSLKNTPTPAPTPAPTPVRKSTKISLKVVDCYSNSHEDPEVCNLLGANKLHTQEHITLPAIVRRNFGLRDPVDGRINQQIRVGVDANGNNRIDETEAYAVYTVVMDYDRTQTAYMGTKGLNRIGASSGMKVIMDTQVLTSPTCPSIGTIGQYECFFNPNPNQRYLIAIAPHGGSNEIGTAQQVDALKQFLVDKTNIPITTYQLLGTKKGGNSHDSYHITSTEIDNTNLIHDYFHVSYPLLSKIPRDYQFSVAFHGFSLDEDEKCPSPDPGANYTPDKQDGHAVVIYIGGRDIDAHKQILRNKIESNVYAVYNNMSSSNKKSYCKPLVKIPDVNSDQGKLYGGDNPENIVNWLSGSGLQFEESSYARYIKNTNPIVKSPFRDSIARAVAE